MFNLLKKNIMKKKVFLFMSFALFAVVLMNFVSISEIRANSITIETAEANEVPEQTCWNEVTSGSNGNYIEDTKKCLEGVDVCFTVVDAIARDFRFHCEF